MELIIIRSTVTTSLTLVHSYYTTVSQAAKTSSLYIVSKHLCIEMMPWISLRSPMETYHVSYEGEFCNKSYQAGLLYLQLVQNTKNCSVKHVLSAVQHCTPLGAGGGGKGIPSSPG